jgi:hypothetical protein
MMVHDDRYGNNKFRARLENDKDVQWNDNISRFRCTRFTGIIRVLTTTVVLSRNERKAREQTERMEGRKSDETIGSKGLEIIPGRTCGGNCRGGCGE